MKTVISNKIVRNGVMPRKFEINAILAALDGIILDGDIRRLIEKDAIQVIQKHGT